MLRIGEFSKLSHLTVKALRFYEKEGLLVPTAVDQWTAYRMYETSQLETAARIKAYRQLGLSIEEIRLLFAGGDPMKVLQEKADLLYQQRREIDVRLSIIEHFLEEKSLKYQVTVKEMPEAIVYYSEVTLPKYSDMMQYIPAIGAECLRLNPHIQCAEPPYEFCEYLDNEHKDTDVRIRHNEAVKGIGVESDTIKFRRIPATKVLSIFHKGDYEKIGEAYAFIMKYAEENGYHMTGLARECYIDGIWNKETVEEWLTEIQLPIV